MTDWRSLLITTTNKQGHVAIKPILANVTTILKHHPAWQGVLSYNAFTSQVIKRRAAPCSDTVATTGSTGDLCDADVIRLVDWLSREEALHVGQDIAHAAVVAVAQTASYHPVRDYLTSLKWDGKQRLGGWLTDYLGVMPGPYTEMVGIKWLISAVARVMQPGCKADHMLVLEGHQGLGKSTALAVLGGSWYTDELADMGSKDAALQLRGAWIIELSELDALHRSETSRVKAFVSRTMDRYREPYGRLVVSCPRQCVFAGTSNHDQYLRDETGNRRFWPVACNRIDTAGLRAVRDMLWAEARTRFECGESWWPDATQSADAASHQSSRYQQDEWQTLIHKYLSNKNEITVADIMSSLFLIDRASWSRRDQMRISQCLTSIGWIRKQIRQGNTREWRYYRPTDDVSPTFEVGAPVGGGVGAPVGDKDFLLQNSFVTNLFVNSNKQ